MVRVFRVLAAGCVCFALACDGGGSDGSPSSLEVTTADSAGVVVVTLSGAVGDLPLWTVSPDPVAAIRGDQPPFLGSVGEVEFLSDGRLLVEDNQSAALLLFDPAGGDPRVVGRRGDGPGEFQNLTELTVAEGDTITSYDRRLYRISRLSGEGSFLESVLVDRELAGTGALVLDAWPLRSGGYLLHSIGAEEVEWVDAAHRDTRQAVLHRLDAEGLQVGDPISFPGGYSIRGAHGDAASPFGNVPFVSARGARILYGSGAGYDLTVTDQDLRPVRVIRWGGWERPLSEAEIRATRERSEADLAQLREQLPQVAEQLLAALFEPTLLPDTLPAISRAMLGPDGEIWVMGFRSTLHRWDETDRWHVLDSLGTPVARLSLPPDTRLLALAPGRVAVVVRDSLDVEHLQVLDLLRGNGPP